MTNRMTDTSWHKFGRLHCVMLIVLWISFAERTSLVLAEESPAVIADTSENKPPVADPQPEIPNPPAPQDQPPESSTRPAVDDTHDPERILNAALEAMDQAALELDRDSPTQQAVQDQELAVELLRKLLSTPQSSLNPPKPSSSDAPSDQQPQGSNAESNGSNGRRTDDENSKESSENVVGPSEAGTSSLIPQARGNNVWGHLPRREQESLLRSLSDNFLPEYEAQIKRYYEALAEGSQGKGGR